MLPRVLCVAVLGSTLWAEDELQDEQHRQHGQHISHALQKEKLSVQQKGARAALGREVQPKSGDFDRHKSA